MAIDWRRIESIFHFFPNLGISWSPVHGAIFGEFSAPEEASVTDE